MKTYTNIQFEEVLGDRRFYESMQDFEAEDEKPFKYKVIIEVIDLKEASGDIGYLLCAAAVKLPKYLDRAKLRDVAEACCITTKEVTVHDIYQYGLYAKFEDAHRVTEAEAMTEVERMMKQAPVYTGLCGFYFDKLMNRAGTTGWQNLSGNI